MTFFQGPSEFRSWDFTVETENGGFTETGSGKQCKSEAILGTHHQGSWFPVQWVLYHWLDSASLWILPFYDPESKSGLLLCFLLALTSTRNFFLLATSQFTFWKRRERERAPAWPRSFKENQAIPLAADQPIVRLLLNLVLTLGPINYGMRRGREIRYEK